MQVGAVDRDRPGNGYNLKRTRMAGETIPVCKPQFGMGEASHTAENTPSLYAFPSNERLNGTEQILPGGQTKGIIFHIRVSAAISTGSTRLSFLLRRRTRNRNPVDLTSCTMGADMAELKVQVFKSITEIQPDIWNRVAAGRGFQSHRWYTFGERAMADCPPTYLIAWDGETPVGAAALFRVHNEPLPLPSIARSFMESIFKHRPLLVCRSPLADTSALLLPGEPERDRVLSALGNKGAGGVQKTKMLLPCLRLPADRTIALPVAPRV